MIKQVYENRSQSVIVKVHPVTPVIEMLKENEYIAENFDANPLFDADFYDSAYWESVGIVTDAIIDWLSDEIDTKEERIIEAIEDGNPYDDEYWEEASTMSDMTKWMWILDEQNQWRDFITISDVTGNPNPYRF